MTEVREEVRTPGLPEREDPEQAPNEWSKASTIRFNWTAAKNREE